MSETSTPVDGAPNEDAAAGAAGKRRRGNGLSGMLLPELQRLAAELGIAGTGRMRKGDLVAAISERQVGAPRTAAEPAVATEPPAPAESAVPVVDAAPAAPVAETAAPAGDAPGEPVATAPTRRRRAASRPAGAPDAAAVSPVQPAAEPTAAPADRTAAPADRTATPADRTDESAAPAADDPSGDRSTEARGDRRPPRSRERSRAERADRPVDAGQDEDDSRGDAGQGGDRVAGDRPERSRGRSRNRDDVRDERNRDDRNRDDRGDRGDDREQGARDQSVRDQGGRSQSGRDQGGRDQSGRDQSGRDQSGRDQSGRDQSGRDRDDDRDQQDGRQGNRNGRGDARQDGNRDRQDGNRDRQDGNRDRQDGNRDRQDRQDHRGDRPDTRGEHRNDEDDDDDLEGGGRRRGRRYRDRNRRGGTTGTQGGGRDRYDQGEPTVSEDDVLLPVAGILDVLDNYAFVRTSGYLTGPNDVYVSLSQVRRYGLRRGDAITGAVRQPREGERKDKYNALVRLDSVNGLDPEQARTRPEFTKLVPLYPQDRLRLETEPHLLTTRVLDLVMPIGKGQRALIVSPPKAGKTMVLQAIANAITTNNPECHLMVVLVDERPEEVTDMQRSVKGEVIASTFDRPATDHTTVAELSIERAKRLVEMGHDVVVLLDSITRLGRAYNLAAPASGRILSGGVDSTALYPPKRFLGAARNIENGGSLTIIASALVETGSTMDTVIFEEFKGTGNAEVKLDRRLADKRVFPAVDVNASSTRKEELLMSPDELAIVIKLRRVLAALEPQQALELLLGRLKKTRNNIEFLMQVQKTSPGE
ncbi:transcription termination factor Rho [Klenkia marina]|uniref:Transcription termination factor Rho n=1 Tax=Klenkia marina TaxID=1960309 RepID=A0A1G4YFZ6_9ACTN|nr:transcription termination factor Rho [Klenkia marina]SCX52431.1 transcription termination factor Rho [Klenkia marina]